MHKKKKEIESLNEKLYTDLSIEELERRLAVEDLGQGERCWTCRCKNKACDQSWGM